MLLQSCPPLLGSIPPNTPHSVIDSRPTWQDNVERTLGTVPNKGPTLETSYPRFIIHPFVRPVMNIVLEALKVSPVETSCFLFPSLKIANSFRSYMYLQCPATFPKEAEIHSVSETLNAPPGFKIFAVLFHSDQMGSAMEFWIFTGAGISSRLAEHCLRRRNGQMELTLGLPTGPDHDYADYYTSHSALSSVSEAKEKIKSRFAGLIGDGIGNIRGVPGLSTSDVYLYSTGMEAIWHVHKMLNNVFGCSDQQQRSMVVHVNVLYHDSYNLLETGTVSHRIFTNDTLDDLEHYLENNFSGSGDTILGIFTDFPGNPHLKSADLPRLRALADKYHIPVIIDDTIASHLNVSVLPFADIVVASLTKLFSGFSNVLGGALLLNPNSAFYSGFKAHLDENYEDNYFDADVLVMELNSRGFEARVDKINRNAEALADWLFSRSKAGGMKEAVIEEVFYPKYQSRENYQRCTRAVSKSMLEGSSGCDVFRPGYGGLLSIVFTSVETAKTFYDTIQCYKGTTVGSVVTLATPYNARALPPSQSEWARKHGLKEALVRFCVGEEDILRILNSVEAALLAAARCTNAEHSLRVKL